MPTTMRLTVALALLVLLVLASAASATSVGGYVSPSTGGTATEFVFVMRYTGEQPAQEAYVVVNGAEHPMSPIDPGDLNFGDGKEYLHRTKLPEGANTYYFKVLDANGTVYKSAVSVLNVKPLLDMRHLDVALAVLLFMIPLVYMIVLLRRLARALEGIDERLLDMSAQNEVPQEGHLPSEAHEK